MSMQNFFRYITQYHSAFDTETTDRNSDILVLLYSIKYYSSWS